MLDIFRKRAQGLIAWFIVLAIGIAFISFGITNYFSLGSHNTTAAKVNGEKISWAAVDNIYRQVVRQYGDQVEEQGLKNQILMTMAQRVALLLKAKSSGFKVGEEQIVQLLLQIPAFQVDGKFSKEQYLKTLAQAAYTDIGFRQELSQDILLGQLEQGLRHSSFTLESELKNNIALLEQKRNFGYMVIPTQKYQKDINVADEEIKTYYETHTSHFVKPETAALEYIELSLEQLSKQIKPSEADILAFYQNHQTAYTTPERIHARHILITAPQENAALAAKAKEKAEGILKELEQGRDFVKLAQKVSEDPGSAEQGGDLGWFVQGQMVPEFEKAAFALKEPGKIAGPVRTQFGYHIIQLIEHKNQELRPFEEVKHLVAEQLKREKAEALFAEKKTLFTQVAFAEARLAPIAQQLGLKIQETKAFSRQGSKDSLMTSHPEILKAAFSEELLSGERHSEPVKLSENLQVIFRVREHKPAVQETLEQAQKQIKAQLLAEKTKMRVKELGETIVKELREGKKPLAVANHWQLKWTEKTNVARAASLGEGADRHIVTAAFQLPAAKDLNQPSVKGLILPNGDYLVVALNKVQEGKADKLDPSVKNSYQQGLTDLSGQLEYSLYATQVFSEAKVEFAKAAL